MFLLFKNVVKCTFVQGRRACRFPKGTLALLTSPGAWTEVRQGLTESLHVLTYYNNQKILLLQDHALGIEDASKFHLIQIEVEISRARFCCFFQTIFRFPDIIVIIFA